MNVARHLEQAAQQDMGGTGHGRHPPVQPQKQLSSAAACRVLMLDQCCFLARLPIFEPLIIEASHNLLTNLVKLCYNLAQEPRSLNPLMLTMLMLRLLTNPKPSVHLAHAQDSRSSILPKSWCQPHLVWQVLHCIAELDDLVAVDAAHPAVDAVHSSSIQVATRLALLNIGKVVGVPWGEGQHKTKPNQLSLLLAERVDE